MRVSAFCRRFLIALFLVVPGLAGCSEESNPVEETGPAENSPPTFLSQAPRTTDHNRPYEYTPDVTDPDGDPVTISVSGLPTWMTFDSGTSTLSGTPGWARRGAVGFTVRASDGEATAVQQISLTVVAGDPVCDQPFGDPADSPYVLPYQVGATYQIIQGNCPTNPAWGHYKWLAYDFDVAMRDTVTASRDGVVIAVQSHNPDGTRECGVNKENFVNVRHADGTVMRYIHLTQNGALVQEGQQLSQGDPIGLSGDSGCSSGPHLHITLHHDATHLGKESTLPVNYRNADGPLDRNNALQQATRYTALSY